MEINWQDSCDFIESVELQAWAMDLGSTCAKLKDYKVKIDLLSVELVADCRWCERQQLGVLRTTLLHVNQQPWMFAQAWVDSNSAAVALLKSKNALGQSLFVGNNWVRSKFYYTQSNCLLALSSSVKPPIFARYSSFKTSKDELCLLEIFLQHEMWD